MTQTDLVGTWIRIGGEPCGAGYPDEIEFHGDGSYVGRMSPGSREHPRWDVGTYEISGGGRLAVSTVNDAILTYAFRVVEDQLVVTDEEGCTFAYRRADEGAGSRSTNPDAADHPH
ncbi:hypothetical protein [Nocardia sp. CY41]|uniref:hypothetical protein n=1 Tax=Nocardia sp. CY41 TaxID=2608686 RepID=UPI0013582B89|nr:hypothetical protein [Nocardia sp. CY41]